jgi:hypothetical protein
LVLLACAAEIVNYKEELAPLAYPGKRKRIDRAADILQNGIVFV